MRITRIFDIRTVNRRHSFYYIQMDDIDSQYDGLMGLNMAVFKYLINAVPLTAVVIIMTDDFTTPWSSILTIVDVLSSLSPHKIHQSADLMTVDYFTPPKASCIFTDRPSFNTSVPVVISMSLP